MSDTSETAAVTELLKERIASRRGRLGACTRKINEIKALMTDVRNIDEVNGMFEVFKEAVEEFGKAHLLVQEFLSKEEKENDFSDWYEPRITNLSYFIKDVEAWKREIAQSKIGPLDSISNVSRKSKSCTSTRSSTSVYSELKKAKAEQAAAMARAAALKQKHTLQMEETKLKSKMEQMELEADLAATTAKIKVIQGEDQKALGDGMNEYYDSHYETETVESNMEFVQLGAVPKTPLQQTILSTFASPPSKDKTSENKTQSKNVNERNKAATQTAQDYSEIAAPHDNLNVVNQTQKCLLQVT
ncbi:uncharacterized protein LOC106512353 [Austrofundulus limnaeus]|uniref:Uncharacterized protein LOC106512353 n=1 Tax=Austrofundulus limnaeus TaxID=52670 RepID=A0A2I4ALT8_AUSLI|nr:PREDICTED: uncharacterized protein LOC106512353 [Austrofundulus limnaeus]